MQGAWPVVSHNEIMAFLALPSPQSDLMSCPIHLIPSSFKALLSPFISFAILPNVRVSFLSLNQKHMVLGTHRHMLVQRGMGPPCPVEEATDNY